MVAKHMFWGMVATTHDATTARLDELVASSGWPLVLEATPRRLARELSLQEPECILFWLEAREALEGTARLIAWSRERGPRPLRIAVACEAGAEVESTLRSAGAHGFLPLVGPWGATVDSLWSLVEAASQSSAASHQIAACARAEPFGAEKSTISALRPP